MISRDSSRNFFAAHWDWLVAAAGVAVLAGVVLWKFVLAEEEDLAAPSGARREAAAVEPVKTTALERTLEGAKSPARVAEVADTKKSFLASELRVFCSAGDAESGAKGCGLPIPFGLEKCPYCGAAQKKEEKPTFDTDGDGLNDDYEKKFGLNPNDASDAEGDLDGDGFTNFEEFEAKTDPSDPASHPDYLDSLRLELPLKQTYTDVMFTGANKTPNGLKLNFKDPKHRNDYDRGIYSVYAGEAIGKTGFIAKGYEQRTRKEKMGGGMEKSVDVSEATIVRERDKKLVRLVLNARKTPTDIQAKLVYDRGGAKEFLVVPGQEIELNGSKYKISEIKKLAKGASVTVESTQTGKQRTIEALEQ